MILKNLAAIVLLITTVSSAGVVRGQDKQPAISGTDTNGRTLIGDQPWAPTEEKGTIRPKVVYGAEDRVDVYQETDAARLQLAKSVCGLLDAPDLVNNGNGTYNLSLSAYTVSGASGCVGEPFRTQPTVMWCTGFLVGEDLIATAGHCYSSADISNTRFVFGFQMADATTPVSVVNADQVYSGVSIVGRQLVGELDYALIRVDRRVTAPGAVPLNLRRAGVVPIGEKVGVIGHPSGLPLKIAYGADTEVYNNSSAGYFVSNLDTFGGNSGSPVFNQATGVVEGILVRGETDFNVSGCFTSNHLADDQAGEDVSKALTFEKLVPGIGFDAEVYRAGDNATLHVVDDNLALSTLPVVLTSPTGDTETITAQDPDNDNVYTLSVPLGAPGATAVPANGVLEVACAQDITASYSDANAGASTARTFTTTASIDCLDPTAEVSISDVSADSATVHIDASEPVTGSLDLTIDCGTAVRTILLNGPATEFHVSLTNLVECQSYGVRLNLSDTAGNEVIVDNAGSCFPFTTVGQELTFSEDFEPAPEPGWASSAIVGSNLWAHETTGLAHSPSHDYNNAPAATGIADAVLKSPVLEAGDFLEFYHTYSFEADGTKNYDGSVLEISTDGGGNWSDLGSRIVMGGYNGTISAAHSNPLGGRQGWVGGTLGTMQKVRVDLTGYTGSVQFRFRIGSDITVSSNGWYIDDVSMVENRTCGSPEAGDIRLESATGVVIPPGGIPTGSNGTLLPDAALGTSTSSEFDIVNSGNGYLEVSSLQLTGAGSAQFSIVPTNAVTLLPGSRHTFEVMFSPSVVGEHHATVTINSDDPDEPVYTFNVQGTAVSEAPTGPDLALVVTDAVKVKAKRKVEQVKVTVKVAVENLGPMAVDSALLVAYHSETPELDPAAIPQFTKTIKKIKAHVPGKSKFKKAKVTLKEQTPTGYLFIRIEPVAPTPTDTNWNNNAERIPYPAL